MGAESKIEWTHHTFNPWWGCTRVSPGCDHCYAETFDRRVGGAHWGKGAPRRTFGDKHWAGPLKWNAAAETAGERHRVFCASMADVFDAEAPAGALDRLWALIRATPRLDWLLLTKRPARIARALPGDWGQGYPNVWLGTTVEDQEHAEQRIPSLLSVPAHLRFLSCEPLLGPVDLTRLTVVQPKPPHGPGVWHNALTGHVIGPDDVLPERIGWVIVGGESGPGARPFHLDWARSLVAQCRAAGVPVFVKQLGAVPVMDDAAWRAGPSTPLLSARNRNRAPAGTVPLAQHDTKGGDPAAWPEDLRVREFPEVSP